MRRFRFSLEKVLRLRKDRERAAELELAEVNGRLAIKERELFLNAEKEQAGRASRFLGSADDMRYAHNYLLRLAENREILMQEIASLELEREGKKQIWIQARKDREVLSRLSEKKAQAHRKESLRAEQATLDEIANSQTISRRESQHQKTSSHR